MKPGPQPLSSFFHAEHIAVIGVSSEPNNLGRNIVKNLLEFGYQGEITSVGLREDVVFGQRVHPSLDEVDGDIQLAVILTPAPSLALSHTFRYRVSPRMNSLESESFSRASMYLLKYSSVSSL